MLKNYKKTVKYINNQPTFSVHETQFTPLEEERPDALEMAAQKNEKGKEAARREIMPDRFNA